jgi:hypothetical protein
LESWASGGLDRDLVPFGSMVKSTAPAWTSLIVANAD